MALPTSFEPLDFIARLAALVPKPQVHLTRFHGVFAPNSAWHVQITPARGGNAIASRRTKHPTLDPLTDRAMSAGGSA